MAFTGPLEDRYAIRERIDAYGDAVFRQDAEAWIANWCDDASWSLPGFSVSGKAAIKSAWIEAMKAFKLAAFFATPGSIKVHGQVAVAGVHTQEILIGHDGRVRTIIGVYDDELVKISGLWLFRRRTYAIQYDSFQT